MLRYVNNITKVRVKINRLDNECTVVFTGDVTCFDFLGLGAANIMI